MPAPFRELIMELTRQIPRGRVSTYSDLAHAAGKPRGARQVGWALNGLPAEAAVPWWRVVKSSGLLPFHHSRDLQAELLRAEGVDVDDDGKLDLRRLGWDAFADPLGLHHGDPEAVSGSPW